MTTDDKFIGCLFFYCYPGGDNGVAVSPALPKMFFFLFWVKGFSGTFQFTAVVWFFPVGEYSGDSVKCRNFGEFEHLMLPRSWRKWSMSNRCELTDEPHQGLQGHGSAVGVEQKGLDWEEGEKEGGECQQKVGGPTLYAFMFRVLTDEHSWSSIMLKWEV